MASYRIYRLDQYGRIAGGGDDFPFSCDREALGHAQSMAEHYPAVEVWQGTRRVGRVSAAGGEEGPRPTARGAVIIPFQTPWGFCQAADGLRR